MKTSIALLSCLLFACADKKSSGQDSGTSDTGGTSDAPAVVDSSSATDGANAGCASCVMTSCGTALTACNANTPCKCTYDCIIAGGAEGTCKSQCSLPGNNTEWATLIDCMDNMCAASCQ